MSEDAHELAVEPMSNDINWIETFTGKRINLLIPKRENIDILDIAHGLSNHCRFTGQCLRFYSVAEHSIHVANLLERDIAIYGLLHDSSEAYMGDIVAPLKIALPDYRSVERLMQMVIFHHFGLYEYVEYKSRVKRADNSMLKAEAFELMHGRGGGWDGMDDVEMPDVQIECMSPSRAERAFLDLFARLTTGGRNEAGSVPLVSKGTGQTDSTEDWRVHSPMLQPPMLNVTINDSQIGS